MSGTNKKINSALISVYHKEGLEPIIKKLIEYSVTIYSTGGTQQYLEDLGAKVIPVEDLTSYPSILGGRVKTLHPKVFGGILARRENEDDKAEMKEHQISEIDLVIVDLYPFSETVESGASEEEIIEKIDIGGISLIRAAAKNFKDVMIIPSKAQYEKLAKILENGPETTLEDRKDCAAKAFDTSSHYDYAILRHFGKSCELRYGENPHQRGWFYGDLSAMFDKLHGKDISYNNILDIGAATALIADFKDQTLAILKHNNACGISSREDLTEAWRAALAGDPLSAFGGIIITNRKLDVKTANEIKKIFSEVVIAPEYEEEALEILKKKKDLRVLVQKPYELPKRGYRSILHGVLEQEKDLSSETKADMTTVTKKSPTEQEYEDLEFANKIVKNTKSNSIVLVRNKQLLASGCGMTSRIDALKFAIQKAKNFGFELEGAVMASDAFFPFPDCVEVAEQAGIKTVIQPGGSVKDQESIDYCDAHDMAMVTTGIRHFKH